MATTAPLFKQITLPDLKGKVDPDWCPGCGDFGVLAAFQKALVDLQIQPHNVVTISGIGCSSNLPGYVSTYGMHTLHGRALAVATGVKLANHELTVAVTGGDHDGVGPAIGLDRSGRPRGIDCQHRKTITVSTCVAQGMRGLCGIDPPMRPFAPPGHRFSAL